jgi:hypothetical protein
MTLSSSEVTKKIIALTQKELFPIQDNTYKEILRELKNIFGSLYYVDGSGNKINIKCTTALQERAIGKQKQENNLVLPFISINENGTINPDKRSAFSPLLVSEKLVDKKDNRIKRYLSLSPRPIDINYDINIWTKYASDMDQIRYSIFSIFNPSLVIKTKFSDFNQATITDESNLGSSTAQDGVDRVMQKTISIKVETYLPSPKFLYTNTGQIESVGYDFEIVS